MWPAVTELFVEQMNNRARELGMKDTHFVNCTGLTAEGHVTSAHDIALMSRELLLHHPEIRQLHHHLDGHPARAAPSVSATPTS